MVYETITDLRYFYNEPTSLFETRRAAGGMKDVRRDALDLASNDITMHFANAMVQELDTRFFSIPDDQLGLAGVAMLLDPTIDLDEVRIEPEELERQWGRLRLLYTARGGQEQCPQNTQQAAEPATQPTTQKKGWKQRLKSNPKSSTIPQDSPVRMSEFEQFQELRKIQIEGDGRTGASSWWARHGCTKFPCLARVARAVLSVTATEASCERVFSRAKAFCESAPNLNAETLDAKVTLRMNLEFARQHRAELRQQLQEEFRR